MSLEVLEASDAAISSATPRQKTLAFPLTIEGKGLFSGKRVEVTLVPAKAGHGIVFQRVDLPGQPLLPARLEYVKATPRCTILGRGDTEIQTVEHFLSAIAALGIDNLLVQVSGPEMPIGDGSALPFVELVRQAEKREFQTRKKFAIIPSPVYFTKNDVTLIALPSEELRISYTLHYPHSSFIGSQFYSFVLDEENFVQEIAPSRTFCLYEEIAPLLEKGVIRGGGLDSAVVIKDDRVANPGGLRFGDEMVRHKILDLIGDLYLLGKPLLAHIIAIRSGHAANVEFAKLLQNSMCSRGPRIHKNVEND